MITGRGSSFSQREIVVKYRYNGEPWKLVFDLDAPDPVASIYFWDADFGGARRGIPTRAERHAPAGRAWEWEEQGVRNMRDEEEDAEARLEEEEEEEEPAQEALDDRGGAGDGPRYVRGEPRALTANDPADPVRKDVTPCWHHRSSMWSCLIAD